MGSTARLLAMCAVLGCGGGSGGDDAGLDAAGGGTDAATADAPASAVDAAPGDGAPGDAAAGTDAAPADAVSPAPDAAPDATPPQPDAGGLLAEHVHILIDNFCNTSASPTSFTVAAGQTLQLTYHNHSVDYDADVWLSYGGGYLGLITGGTWADQFTFCTSPNPYTAYADISIAGGGGSACPGYRLLIHCQ